jgi:hypothetical protein
VSTDATGNVFVAGYFSSPTITFGSATLINSDNLGRSIFIVKYDANGNVLWAKSPIGGGEAISVSTDAGGNVFITGKFGSPTVTFGSTTLSNNGAFDIFIAKYDANGNVLWAQSAGGVNNDDGISVSADANGNVFVTGYFQSHTITFGSTILTNVGPSLQGPPGGDFPDLFIVKYDANGNVLWAKSAGGTKDDYGWSLSADANGNVFITGSFESRTITFGSTILTNTDTSSGSNDVFVAKYDAGGNMLWAKSAGGMNNDDGLSISADINGNAFLTGSFQSSSITFDSKTLIRPSNSNYPMFIVKYTANGNVICASTLAAGGFNGSVNVDLFGNAFIVGFFDANPFIVGIDTLQLTGVQNVFVAKYRCDGKDPAAINEIESNVTLDVFPNPVSNAVTIKFSSSAKGKLILNITNGLGAIVYSENKKDFSGEYVNTIDLSKQPKGIYFVEMILGSDRRTRKIIIE